MSDLAIHNSNSSYLKISFDVKNRDVKSYEVELWDIKDNLIKTEKTEKVGENTDITRCTNDIKFS